MRHTLRTSGLHRYGQSMSSLATCPSTTPPSHRSVQHPISHISQRYGGFVHWITHPNAQVTQLPDDFADAYAKEFGVPPPPDVYTHCRRELFHEVIKLILQGRFAEAYRHGILIRFPDGVTRRVFPRFYCYSADYPEKYVHGSPYCSPVS